jgi:hypothetical protein
MALNFDNFLFSFLFFYSDTIVEGKSCTEFAQICSCGDKKNIRILVTVCDARLWHCYLGWLHMQKAE